MIDNLPTNPEIGDQFTTAKGVTYTYDGVKWKGSLVQQIAVAGPQGEVGPQGPAGPQGEPGPQGPAGKDATRGALNYVQEKASRSIRLTSPSQVIDVKITTTGRPVLISVNGDANPLSNGGWCKLQLFRNNTAISNIVQAEGGNNENNPYNLSMIDAVPAGTYTYSFRMIQHSGDFQFGEADGPTMYAIEL
jgi:hypothetical protein